MANRQLAPSKVENTGKFLDRIWSDLNRAALSVGDFKGFMLENSRSIAKRFKIGREKLLLGFMDPSLEAHKQDNSPIGYVMLGKNFDGYDGHAYGVSYSFGS